MNRKKIVTNFYRQLAILLEAGFPLVRALNTLASRLSHRKFQAIIRSLVVQVERGTTFSESLTATPEYFPALHVQLIRAGEGSGNLTTVLDRLATAGMREIAIRNRVKTSLVYPCLVLLVAVVLIGFLATTIVPTFSDLFAGFDVEPPPQTQFLLDASQFLKTRWYILILGLIALVLLVRGLLAIRALRYYRDHLKLRFRFLGPMTREYIVVHTCRTLGMLLQSGIHLLRALELTRDASSNLVVASGLAQAREEVERGRSLEGPLRRTGIFPPDVVDMVVTAQETGSLAENLIYAADLYEEELNNRMQVVSSMTEPMLILVVGAVVAFVALSLFLPYIKLLNLMSGGQIEE
jgi:type IV pilus assembly protein PilC